MAIVETKGDTSPRGILRYWERKTKPECAREILRCWNEIERLEKRVKELSGDLARAESCANRDCEG